MGRPAGRCSEPPGGTRTAVTHLAGGGALDTWADGGNAGLAYACGWRCYPLVRAGRVERGGSALVAGSML